MNATETAIRENFAGKSNAGLRAEIREAAKIGRSAVEGVARRVGLTVHGRRGLDNVLATLPQDEAVEN